MSPATVQPFQVVLTADFYRPDGAPAYRDMGLDVLQSSPRIAFRPFAQHHPEIAPDQLDGANGVIVLTPKVTARSVSRAENLLAVGRFGVGYDAVDVPACTAADVLLFITAGAVDRSVAEATVGWMLALTHNMRAKDRLVREGGWDRRSSFMGREPRERTLGIVGLGGIGRALVRLLAGFGMQRPLAFDPLVDPKAADELGVRLTTLDELMASADFVSIHCPLNDKTRNLIDAHAIGLMRPDAYLINTARGGIVDEAALEAALRAGRIAGAALDCFEREPLVPPHRWTDLDNILLAPHSIAWTDELFRDIGRAVCQGMVDLAEGRRPRGAVNPEVFDRPGFQSKWSRLCG